MQLSQTVRHLSKMSKGVNAAVNCVADRFKGQKPSIWVTINELVAKEKPINMGQGFADFLPPAHVTNALQSVVTDQQWPLHQYTRAFGHVRLVNALAKLYSPFYGGRSIDPLNEILISVGAYGSLFTAINALINPGDEVIIIEPFFDSYEPVVSSAGGKPVFVQLKPPKERKWHSSADWTLSREELVQKITPSTKMLIFNTPNNPMGKVFSMEETQMIADVCKEHNIICLADEVYEWLVYPPHKHIKIATLPGMWERTITVGSVGKTFNVTGWKLGWTVAPVHYIKAMQLAHQNCVYTCPTPLQDAAARALEVEISRLGSPDSYWRQIVEQLQQKRDHIAKELERVGMHPVLPDGGYFIMADISEMAFPDNEANLQHEARDVRFNTWMVKQKKLSAIPPTVFYSKENQAVGERFMRFCFIKDDSTLEKCFHILRNWNHA